MNLVQCLPCLLIIVHADHHTHTHTHTHER
jgi:hypothetical protein